MMRERTQSNSENGNMEQKIRMKGKGVEGEIVQVQGGHIIRSTSQKDRHCKVYTAKGPRDRRVRLSAHTAIQFYDVQDRLGYDRPSKAVDWLIEKAKDAIDELDGLTPWHPNNTSAAKNSESNQSSSGTKVNIESESSFDYRPEPDTEFMTRKKSFFQTSSAADPLMNYQNFPRDIMSRASFQAEDLGLSLHTLQDQNSRPSTNPGPSGSTFQDNYQGMDSWSGNGSIQNRVGFPIDSNAMPQVQQAFFSQDMPFSHRELLHSNYSNFIQHNPQASVHQSSDSGSHFAFSFQVPARIHGDNEPEIQN